MKTDILVVGCGVAGLYAALCLPEDKKITVISKAPLEESDSYLAQGGICVLRDDDDYDAFFEDTLKAGHYENNTDSVDLMISASRDVIDELISFGVEFERDEKGLRYTREGAHSRPRILFRADQTGKEITSKLLSRARSRKNIQFIENYTMVDILEQNGECVGVIGHNSQGEYSYILSDYTLLATGGIGGLYPHSTNFPHLTGDALAIAINHGIRLQNVDYVQIHPTTLYTREKGRSFLISESVRGEGAVLLNNAGERFVNELLPRDLVSAAIFAEMEREEKPHVWLSLEKIPTEDILSHFPTIYARCLDEGYDITRESVPVVPAQHYFMGGIAVDRYSATSMPRLYAAGETACNGVHGKNRLASNSLLESLVFARRAARHLTKHFTSASHVTPPEIDPSLYENYPEIYKEKILKAIKGAKKK